MATKLTRLWTDINASRSQRHISALATTSTIVWRTKTFKTLPNKLDHQYNYICSVKGRSVDYHGNLSDIR